MTRRFFRSRNDRMVSGVAAGLADYLQIDPVLIRAAFVLAAFADGMGVLAYIILWILTPQQPWAMAYNAMNPGSTTNDDERSTMPFPRERSGMSGTVVFGIILIVLGAITLTENLIPQLDLSLFWPVLLIAIGVGLIVKSRRSAYIPTPSTDEQVTA